MENQKIKEWVWKSLPPGIFYPVTLLDILKAHIKTSPSHKLCVEEIVCNWNLDKADIDDQEEWRIKRIHEILVK